MIQHRDCMIQLLDLPGIIRGAALGVGRGRQVIAPAKPETRNPKPETRNPKPETLTRAAGDRGGEVCRRGADGARCDAP
jgi:hypothetical protein